ncbi:MAG: RNA ligase family protein [Cellulosilyticaceae bacterium]
MKEIKKYTDIVRYGKSGTQEVLQKGDYISITEKIDGANASFCLDESTGIGITAYSRNNPLGEHNTLRGFYDFVVNQVAPIKYMLNSNYRYFGEWLVSHKVVYKPEQYGKFYMFSIWDDEKQEYLSDDIVKSEAERLGLLTTTYFYEGEFISFEHMMSFVGKSDRTLEPNTGEGVVVKNVSYKRGDGKQVFVKLVSERFAEVQKQKLPKNPNIEDEHKGLIDTVVTLPRIEKIIHKMVDEGILGVSYGIEDMSIILRHLGNLVHEDIVKEEFELVKHLEEKMLKKKIGKSLPLKVKQILKEQKRL